MANFGSFINSLQRSVFFHDGIKITRQRILAIQFDFEVLSDWPLKRGKRLTTKCRCTNRLVGLVMNLRRRHNLVLVLG